MERRVAMVAARMAKGLTQEQLALLVELSPDQISLIERGLRVPKPVAAKRISKVLGVPVRLLFPEYEPLYDDCDATAAS